MSAPSIVSEDHLRPIAVVDGRLTCFSALDGKLYHSAAAFATGEAASDGGAYTRTSLGELAFPLCIPGVPVIYDVEHAGDRVTVRAIEILVAGLGEAHGWSTSAPDADAYALSAMVPDATGTACMVFVPIGDAENSLLVDVHHGRMKGAIPKAESPAGLLADGTIVSDRADGTWCCRSPAGTNRSGPGCVVSMCSAFALVSVATRTSSSFSVVRSTGVEEVLAPEGWTLKSAGASDEALLAYGVHATLGQKLFARHPDGGPLRSLPAECGTATVFAMSAAGSPIARCAGLRLGSRWLCEDRWIVGAAGPRVDISVKHETVQGLPCVLARSARRPRARRAPGLIVGLHGGPDSYELDALRYGGAYREMLDSGYRCLVVNYEGSTAFGPAFQMSAWRAWTVAAQRVAAAVQEVAARHACRNVTLLGVSFGAWIGLQAATHLHCVSRVIALSPILDLTGHLRQHSPGNEAFAAWAAARFGSASESAMAGDAMARSCRAEVVVLAPVDDEVVSPARTSRVVLDARANGLPWRLEPVPGRHYPQTATDAATRWTTLVSVATRSHASGFAHPGPEQLAPVAHAAGIRSA